MRYSLSIEKVNGSEVCYTLPPLNNNHPSEENLVPLFQAALFEQEPLLLSNSQFQQPCSQEVECAFSEAHFLDLQRTYGNKYANLVKLGHILGDKVPLFFGFSDAQIKTMLSEKTLEKWQEAKINYSSSPQRWDMHAYYLEQVQESVKEDILSHELPFTDQQRQAFASLQDKQLIVRSTSNEDDQEGCVNAGGNETVDGVNPIEQDLKNAIAEVVASYFSYQSIKNRASFGDPFQDLPLCSVLVMEQITEDPEDAFPITSGVMMTHQMAWTPQSEETVTQITATWGFGGGVVSGKVPCDQWVLTENYWYSAIQKKNYRLVAAPSAKCCETSNPVQLHERPALSDRQIEELQTDANKIEKFYKKPMDVEFVIKNDRLFVVQARPARASSITSPNLLDPTKIPTTAVRFQGDTFLSGTNQVLNLEGKNICFAKDLAGADDLFNPSKHKAVVIYTLPLSKNTHAEVNFSSHRPPTPCLVLSETMWNMCQTTVKDEQIKLCPQTGTLVLSSVDIPIREGLFIHPARFTISVEREGKGIQGSSRHRLIVNLKQLLTATSEDLKVNLDEIDQGLHDYFEEISARKIKTASLIKAAQSLQRVSFQIFEAMRQSAAKEHPTMLSLHASMLRHLLTQVNTRVIGAHSFAGLEEATTVSKNIALFMQEHEESNTLCELALLANKAFEEAIQDKWLAFLRDHQGVPAQQWEKLLAHLQVLDSLGIVPLWLSLHFADEQPQIEHLFQSNVETEHLLAKCHEFEQRFDLITQSVENISSEEDLVKTWETLWQESQKFIKFGTSFKRLSVLESLQLSRTLVELIQLWDFNIKAVRTSKVLSVEREAELFKQRINQFTELGRQLCERTSINMAKRKKVSSLLKYIQATHVKETSCTDHSFSVQQWIVPQGTGNKGIIQSDDQRLTICHQNLLQAACPEFSSDFEKVLPLKLAQALRIFSKNNPSIVKRFASNNGTFISMFEDWAKVKINIPLNLHSCVVEIIQRKGSEELELKVYWRANDNDQTHSLGFLQMLALLTGITLKNAVIRGGDLEVAFSVKDKKQFKLLSKAIFKVNEVTLDGSRNYLRKLSLLIHGEEAKKEPSISRKEILDGIIDFILKRYLETGKTPNLLDEEYLEDYFNIYPLTSEITDRVAEELKGKPSPSTKVLREVVLNALPIEKREEMIWTNLTGSQSMYFWEISSLVSLDIFRRLTEENPEKAVSYYLDSFTDNKEFQAIFRNFTDPLLRGYVETGNMPSFITEEYLKRYFSKNEIIPEVAEMVLNELTGKSSPGSRCKVARVRVLKSLPKERRTEFIWEDLIGPQLINDDEILSVMKDPDILIRLFKENPEKSDSFWKKFSSHKNQFEQFLNRQGLMD